jgi:hypothetical protein
MQNHKKLLPIALILGIIAFVAIPPTHASAFSFGELFNNVKNFIAAPFIKHELTIDQKIELAPGGDMTKNGQIDSGDTVKYTFTIANKTDKTYKSVNFNTNVSVGNLNTINNITGTVSLDTSKNIVVIPNLTFTPNQYRIISFEAKVNFFKDKDKSLSAESELVDENKKSIHKEAKKSIVVKKLDAEKFNKYLHINN